MKRSIKIPIAKIKPMVIKSYYPNKLLFRGTYKNMKYIGYREWHGIEQTEFYIS